MCRLDHVSEKAVDFFGRSLCFSLFVFVSLVGLLCRSLL